MMVTNIGFNDGSDNASLIRILIIAREKEVVGTAGTGAMVTRTERQIIILSRI